MMKRALAALCMALGTAAVALAGETKTPDTMDTKDAPAAHGMVTPADIKWTDGPASLPKGAKMAVLEGDPKKAELFTMRIRVPDGYKVMPHWHPAVEHLTVISGTFHLGMGNTFDASKGAAMPAGSFAYMPPKMVHYAWATGETEVQVHAMGPWALVYVNPADDPSGMQKAAK